MKVWSCVSHLGKMQLQERLYSCSPFFFLSDRMGSAIVADNVTLDLCLQHQYCVEKSTISSLGRIGGLSISSKAPFAQPAYQENLQHLLCFDTKRKNFRTKFEMIIGCFIFFLYLFNFQPQIPTKKQGAILSPEIYLPEHTGLTRAKGEGFTIGTDLVFICLLWMQGKCYIRKQPYWNDNMLIHLLCWSKVTTKT